MRERIQALAFLVTAGAIVVSAITGGCELMVQLDRSFADAGGDAACPICTDAGSDDAGDDTDGGAEGGVSDAAEDHGG